MFLSLREYLDFPLGFTFLDLNYARIQMHLLTKAPKRTADRFGVHVVI